MSADNLRVKWVEVEASMLEELQRKAAAYDATNAAQAEQLAVMTNALEQIRHSMQQAVIHGNDRLREIQLSGQLAGAALLQSSIPISPLDEIAQQAQELGFYAQPQAGVELTDDVIWRLWDQICIYTADRDDILNFAYAIERALNQRQAVKAEPQKYGEGHPFSCICSLCCKPLSAAQGVPEGWKLVPLEPTSEQEESFLAAAIYHVEYGEDVFLKNLGECLRATYATPDDQLAKDAARYRWLRAEYESKRLDAAIDSAISTGKGKLLPWSEEEHRVAVIRMHLQERIKMNAAPESKEK